jgi:hypothetical protein
MILGPMLPLSFDSGNAATDFWPLPTFSKAGGKSAEAAGWTLSPMVDDHDAGDSDAGMVC